MEKDQQRETQRPDYPRLRRREANIAQDLQKVWGRLREAFIESEGITLSSSELSAVMKLVIALEESLRESQAEKARVRLAFERGGRDAVVKELGLTDPKRMGMRSPVNWTWTEAADWFSEAVSGQGNLNVPIGMTLVDMAVVEACARAPKHGEPVLKKVLEFAAVTHADPWRVKELGGLLAVERPADPAFAVHVVAYLMGVAPRRARTALRPKLKGRELDHLLPPERAFR